MSIVCIRYVTIMCLDGLFQKKLKNGKLLYHNGRYKGIQKTYTLTKWKTYLMR